VYIGDDASPGNPTELLEKYKGLIDFVYHRFERNCGSTSLVKQWDRCIALSSDEEWIMILGDDDVLDANTVSTFYENIEAINVSNICVIRFASRYIDANGIALKGYKDFLHPKIEKSTDSYFKHYMGKSRSSLSEYIFNRKSYEKYKFQDFPLAWHSDDKAWLDYTNCGNIFTINNSVVEVRLSKNNISGRIDNLELKNKSRYLFFKDILFNKLSHFSRNQKIEFLLEYGILIKEQHQINIKNVIYIAFKLLGLGAFSSFLKFMRRMFIAKFKNMN
jgi:hypothetical protein